jgi:hypothetical protein
MKRSLALLVVVVCAAASAFSQTLTQADRAHARQYLESTEQGVLMQPLAFPRRNGTSSPRQTGGPSQR